MPCEAHVAPMTIAAARCCRRLSTDRHGAMNMGGTTMAWQISVAQCAEHDIEANAQKEKKHDIKANAVKKSTGTSIHMR